MHRNVLIGVDIGGTFTDLVMGEENGQEIQRVKTLTTPDDPVRGVMTALTDGLRLAKAAPSEVKRFVHATTLTTNLVLERKGSRTAYVTTAGFGDVFGIGKRAAVGNDAFDMLYVRSPPFVPRDMVFELPERMAASGGVVRPLDVEAAHLLAAQIAEARPEAVAVCLLHAYANGAHETQFAEVLRSYLPGAYVALSSQIWPEMQEYERGVTTLVSAYIGPTFSGYVRRLEDALREAGVACPLQIMQSSGGIMAAADAAARAAYTLESGPAAGVVSTGRLGEQCGYPNIISFDMGGTTAKAGLVERGRPRITHNFRVGAGASAQGNGGGEPIRLPVIDLAEVGAGGGSIASVDLGGFLTVGPESAGAAPGPACYGLGGERPTVTDANLVLGYLDPKFFLGGRMPLDLERARGAIRKHVAGPLGIGEVAAAWRIHELANTSMGAAVRMVSVHRGVDPRQYVLSAFGGAGPLHAVRVAEEFGIPNVLVPPFPGVRSAFGLLQSDLSYDFIRTSITPAINPKLELLNQSFALLEQRVKSETASDALELQRSVEMRFTHQSLRLRVNIPGGPITEAMIADAEASFRLDYFKMCAISSTDTCQIVNCWLKAVGTVPKPAPQWTADGAGDPARARKSVRSAYFPEAGGFVEAAIYDRALLSPGDQIDGPILVEEPESTTVLPPGFTLRIDNHLNLIIEPR